MKLNVTNWLKCVRLCEKLGVWYACFMKGDLLNSHENLGSSMVIDVLYNSNL